MTGKISKCGICGQIADSMAALKTHKDVRHRIGKDDMNKSAFRQGNGLQVLMNRSIGKP